MSLPEEIVAGTADALIAVDTAGVIEHWNPADERLLGFPEAAALDQTLGSSSRLLHDRCTSRASTARWRPAASTPAARRRA